MNYLGMPILLLRDKLPLRLPVSQDHEPCLCFSMASQKGKQEHKQDPGVTGVEFYYRDGAAERAHHGERDLG